MQTTAQRFQVPAGFTGWWCARCEQERSTIPEEAGSPARCPKCHRWTVWWITASSPESKVQGPMSGASKRAQRAEERALKAGAPYERTRPKDEDAKRLFDHARHVIENPGLNPSLREIEHQKAIE